MKETNSRSIAKSITWRVLATLSSILLIYLFVGSFKQAIVISIVGAIMATILYFIHERIWNMIKWGKKV